MSFLFSVLVLLLSTAASLENSPWTPSTCQMSVHLMFTRPEWVNFTWVSVHFSWQSAFLRKRVSPSLATGEEKEKGRASEGARQLKAFAGRHTMANGNRPSWFAQWPLTFALVNSHYDAIILARIPASSPSSSVFISLPRVRLTCWSKQSFSLNRKVTLLAGTVHKVLQWTGIRSLTIITATQCILEWTCNCASPFIYLLHFKTIHSSFPTSTRRACMPQPWWLPDSLQSHHWPTSPSGISFLSQCTAPRHA